MDYIKTFEKDSREYRRLEALAQVLNNYTVSRYGHTEPIKVETVYFDFGQNWFWTTITCGYQVLCPREQEILISAPTVAEGIADVIAWHNANQSKWGTIWEEI